VPAVADRYFRTIYSQLANGFCWYCEGRLDLSVVSGAALADDPADLAGYPDWYDEFPVAFYRCRRCGAEPTADLGTALADHPTVVSFYSDRGVDTQDASSWELAAWRPDRARVRERDPLRATVTYTADGDDLPLVVDDDCAVLAVEKTSSWPWRNPRTSASVSMPTPLATDKNSGLSAGQCQPLPAKPGLPLGDGSVRPASPRG